MAERTFRCKMCPAVVVVTPDALRRLPSDMTNADVAGCTACGLAHDVETGMPVMVGDTFLCYLRGTQRERVELFDATTHRTLTQVYPTQLVFA